MTVTATGSTDGIAEVVLFVRRGEGGEFRRITMNRAGTEFSTELDPLGDDGAQLYVEARAPSGYVLARVGSAEEPRPLAATVEPSVPGDDSEVSRPWYRRWWVWTIIGAVVVGGTVTGVVLGTRGDEHQVGTLGEVTMPLSGFERSR